MTIKKLKLTQRQETFCLEYFKTGKSTESAITAGYSKKTAPVIASENLTKPKIEARLQELRKASEDASIMDVKERKQKLSEIARARLVHFVNDAGEINLQAENNAALQEVSIEDWQGGPEGRAQSRTKKVKLHNPINAIAELNKMDRIYTEGYLVNQDNRRYYIIAADQQTKEEINWLLKEGREYREDD